MNLKAGAGEPKKSVSRPEAVIEVVAAVLTHRDRVGLFRRSRKVRGDAGRWHCITGFLPAAEDPQQQALNEIQEETGIDADQLERGCTAVLELEGADGTVWRVHAFHFSSRTETVTLNWEHDEACWRCLDQFDELPTVPWLAAVLEALAETLPSVKVVQQ